MNGVLGRFVSAEDVTAAARKARGAGPWRVEAFSPYPVAGLAEALEPEREWLPTLVLAAGVMGGAGGLALQYWAAAVAYPLNVGGRPLASWPSFLPVAFELTVLFAAFAAGAGLLALCGLPRPHHPLFEVAAFRAASRDKFFLQLLPQPGFDAQAAREFLVGCGADRVFDVP